MLKCKSDDTKLSEPEKFKMQTLGAALPGRCDDEAIAYIAEHFGKRLQVAKTIEELSEASTELARALLAELDAPGKINFEALAEELADAQIMIEQMIYLFDIDERVDDYRVFKLDTTLRIVKERENAGKRRNQTV